MPRLLDIHTILSEEERIPVKFKTSSRYMNHLNPNHDTNNHDDNDNDDVLPEGTKVELPIWLALNLHQENWVDIELPKQYGNKMAQEIKAGAEAINLKEYSYYYFDTGLSLANALQNTNHAPVAPILRDTLRKALSGNRYTQLMVRSLANYKHDDLADYYNKLTHAEYIIFDEGLRAANDLASWRSGQASKLQKANILKRTNNNNTNESEATKRQKS